jgi:glycosyltransferase involved in cell wall biosynthesis
MKRILHIVGGMNRGGVETWLMHVLRHIDRARYHMDFLVHTTEPCAYDDEIRALGSKIIPCLHPSKPFTYTKKLRAILQEGQYDVVHSHVHHFSGWTLRTAAQAGVPVRIAHSHSDTSSVQARASLPRRAYLTLMHRWMHQYATRKLSVSRQAAGALFGRHWAVDADHQLLYYGIDLSPFAVDYASRQLRASLGIPESAFVIGHVGRFSEVKNHAFLIKIAAEICQREPDVYFLLVGDGPLRPQIEQQATQAGLNGRVIFAGLRDDVARIMLGAMDCFLLPSLYEGLGIVLIEAQAAGLPCVYSDVVPQEAAVVPQLVQTMSLSQPAAGWAQAVLAYRERKAVISQSAALDCVRHSPFNIEQSVSDLVAVYDG